jgi:hypothetical protein
VVLLSTSACGAGSVDKFGGGPLSGADATSVASGTVCAPVLPGHRFVFGEGGAVHITGDKDVVIDKVWLGQAAGVRLSGAYVTVGVAGGTPYPPGPGTDGTLGKHWSERVELKPGTVLKPQAKSDHRQYGMTLVVEPTGAGTGTTTGLFVAYHVGDKNYLYQPTLTYVLKVKPATCSTASPSAHSTWY